MDSKQEIISKLKFIGKIKKGEKINTRHMYVQPDGFRTSLSRTFIYQDNRGNALSFCQETVSRAFELLITFGRSECNSDRVLFAHLLDDLKQATVGLKNLKVTYITDTKFCCDMDALLEEIDARLCNYDFGGEQKEHDYSPASGTLSAPTSPNISTLRIPNAATEAMSTEENKTNTDNVKKIRTVANKSLK